MGGSPIQQREQIINNIPIAAFSSRSLHQTAATDLVNESDLLLSSKVKLSPFNGISVDLLENSKLE